MKKITFLLAIPLLLFSCSNDGDDITKDQDDDKPDTIELTCEDGGMVVDITGDIVTNFGVIGTDLEDPDGGGYVTGSYDGLDMNLRGYSDESGTEQIEISFAYDSEDGSGDFSDQVYSIGYSNTETDEYYQSQNDGTISLVISDIDYITDDYGCITIEFSCKAYNSDNSKSIFITGELKMETEL